MARHLNITRYKIAFKFTLTSTFTAQGKFNHSTVENENLAIEIRNQLMSELAHKGIAGYNLECLVSNKKIVSTMKFWSYSTDSKHVGCFEVSHFQVYVYPFNTFWVI
jgi:hypothetical protein